MDGVWAARANPSSNGNSARSSAVGKPGLEILPGRVEAVEIRRPQPGHHGVERGGFRRDARSEPRGHGPETLGGLGRIVFGQADPGVKHLNPGVPLGIAVRQQPRVLQGFARRSGVPEPQTQAREVQQGARAERVLGKPFAEPGEDFLGLIGVAGVRLDARKGQAGEGGACGFGASSAQRRRSVRSRVWPRRYRLSSQEKVGSRKDWRG